MHLFKAIRDRRPDVLPSKPIMRDPRHTIRLHPAGGQVLLGPDTGRKTVYAGEREGTVNVNAGTSVLTEREDLCGS